MMLKQFTHRMSTSPPQTITNLIAGENGYFIGTVQLNIWVEGWDQNAIDAVLEAFVNVSLGFTLVTP